MHVGVFPQQHQAAESMSRLPHARGGVSAEQLAKDIEIGSSPCTWGCFLIPNLFIASM